MEAKEKYDYWLDIAQYDLDSADAMATSRRWLYTVFMCQQAIEKLIKGLYIIYVDDDIPRIHNINAIIGKFEEKLPLPVSEENKELFRKLSMYYISNRYPDYLAKLSGQIKETEATEILRQTKEVFKWLLTLA